MNTALQIFVTAWLVADFSSGLFHWWEDRYLTGDSWLFGKLVGGPNVEHHKHPARMCRSSYWDRNATTLVPSLIGAALAAWWGSPGFTLGFLWLSHANEIHSWAHQRCSWPIRLLQETGLLQSTRVHGEHHKQPFDQNYCVVTDWLNPWLHMLGFWVRLERIVAIVTGIKPLPERATA